MLHTTLMIVLFFSAAGIVALVLLQRGKGADAGAGFGAGASGTVFGARGAGNALSRATAVLMAVFMVACLSLTYVGSRTSAAPSTVLDRMSQPVKRDGGTAVIPAKPSAPALAPPGATTLAPTSAPAVPVKQPQ